MRLPVQLSRAVRRPTHPRRNLTPRCTYHSERHPEPAPFPDAQERLLSAAMRHVPAQGFSRKALTEGASESGYPEVSIQLLPRGVFDLINYHLVTQRRTLRDRVQFPEDSKLGVGQKVKTLTIERLRANRDVIHHWPTALGHMSLLGNLPSSLQELAALSDEIWYLAGDTAVDTSWYTKRASLAAVYASAELFMTTDASKGYASTEEFVDRALEDVQKVGGTVGGLGQFVGFWAGSTLNLARSWGIRI